MRPVIVGAGHNGLVAAFYLAKSGLRPLVLERRAMVGGCAVTEEIAPGYRGSLAHALGPVRQSVIDDMQLERRVEFVSPEPRLVALTLDGRALRFFPDAARTAESVRAFSSPDADRYPEFASTLERLGGFLRPLLESTPPALDSQSAGDWWKVLTTGRRFRALGRKDAFRLLRWMPMAAADLVTEFFSSEPLLAAVASRGIFGTAQGPWSAGTGAVLLMDAARDPAPGGTSVTVKGGAGALTAAMADAAREAGAEIRTSAGVRRIAVHGDRVTGVHLDDGSEIATDTVIANADPKRTFLELIDPGELDPSVRRKAANYRARGTVAKLDFALGGLPVFKALSEPGDLAARIHLGPTLDYLEHAFDPSKYGDIPSEPYLDVALPSVNDPSLAPPGRHVLSVHVQFVPNKLHDGRSWHELRETLAKIVISTIERYAPGVGRLVEGQRVLTPADLEDTYGLTGGHIFHGEPSLDQMFVTRPVMGWAQYRTPVEGLFLCGAGTHPGGGITGGPGQNAAREIAATLKRSRSSRSRVST
jgi:phytoene dehydrogenase-like protein